MVLLTSRQYLPSEQAGVMSITIAGLISLLSILLLLTTVSLQAKTYRRTHMVPYLLSLLGANAIQSSGSVMSLRWVVRGEIVAGGFCSVQGGVKQAGNVATALWSFMISVHLFNLIFLRYPTTRTGLALTQAFGWLAVTVVVIAGPTIIENTSGPYFGISGYWCWITSAYPKSQTYMEYLFEFLSAGLSFLLYSVILLRVRGNLILVDGRWRLQWVGLRASWRLAFGRDVLDSAMLDVMYTVVWFPIGYMIVLVPIAIARLISFSGHVVPFWATVLTDVVFNLTGLVNVILLFVTFRIFPEGSALPEFTTPRKAVPLEQAIFVVPFTLTRSDTLSRDDASDPPSSVNPV